MTNKYSEYRGNIKSGDILAFSHKGWNSWKDFKSQMVRVFTRSDYSHVGLAVVMSGRVMILENIIPCVRLFPLSKLGSFYHVPMNVDWTPEVEEKAFSYLGNEYSQWQAIKAFFVNLGKGNTSECAALVSTVLYNANVYMGDKQTPDAIVLQSQIYGHATNYVENN